MDTACDCDGPATRGYKVIDGGGGDDNTAIEAIECSAEENTILINSEINYLISAENPGQSVDMCL